MHTHARTVLAAVGLIPHPGGRLVFTPPSNSRISLVFSSQLAVVCVETTTGRSRFTTGRVPDKRGATVPAQLKRGMLEMQGVQLSGLLLVP
ncbi:hypothetical protein RB213_012886 [Colletotrichum asianum]